MPVPTQYSEPQFAAYLASVLDTLADALGWDASDPRVLEAVTDTLLEYGVSDIATITGSANLRHLRAFGRRAIFRAVVNATAGKYDFSDSDAKFNRSQIHDMAQEALKNAITECLEWDPAYAMGIVSVNRPHDPYAVRPDADRVP